MPPRPPTSTLFPYTTLFRSRLRNQLGQRVYPVHRLDRPTSGVMVMALDAITAARLAAAFREHQDRKSTRLNSSHVAISYAVFCLKKKRKKLYAVQSATEAQ